MEWTKSDTLKFIEMLQQFPCLWNVKSAEYKNRTKKRDALMALAQGMGMEMSIIEKKILSLKSQFNRELNKVKTKSGAGAEDAYQSSWYAFKYLQFIKDNNVPRSSTDTLTDSIDNDEESMDILITDQGNVDPIATPTDEQLITPSSSAERHRTNKRKCCDTSALSALQDASNAIINRNKKDEFSTYGEYIASELRHIKSEYNLLKLKRDISMLIYDTKLKITKESQKENTAYSVDQ